MADKESYGSPRGELCPRCGKNQVYIKDVWNSSSRVEQGVYICSPCGSEEAMNDLFKVPHTPRSEWFDRKNGK